MTFMKDETLSKKWNDAYTEGFDAHPRTDCCPYSPGSQMEQYAAWNAGWNDADLQREKDLGRALRECR